MRHFWLLTLVRYLAGAGPPRAAKCWIARPCFFPKSFADLHSTSVVVTVACCTLWLQPCIGILCPSVPSARSRRFCLSVSVLDARDGNHLHAQKRHDRLSPHPVAAPGGVSDQG
jgi:hypothetical protein